ncbi:(4Fe-4S)-binding protein [Algoriphagus halophytocola]|uniref:(4Fe-4S)-binding protein n=1 Tax=Algoriphagus halophytocola TaxID=2991499 RepID=A0ABY6MK98_9BACT|nr:MULTISPECIES: (4Fe-4S)-binding protein [unclassified Algoriphagus]UZD23086.1 (4Fe-4S)-binding protein [Algoriphagus sp. TR-M5]WBL44378.1 (4Fe-4S)-binding protein [Algoriphagus sp. TR-M9]
MEKPIKKEYSNGDITIIWEPHKCIHSKNCVNGLPKVFDFNRRPWIVAEGTHSEDIAKQIDKCPSGALGYYFQGKETDEPTKAANPQQVEISPNGPLLIFGKVKIKTTEGEVEKDSKVTAFCRCGSSQNKPYCDGTHQKIDFQG